MKWIILFLVSLGEFLVAQKAVVTPLGPEGGVISLLNGSLDDEVVLAVVRETGLYRSIDGGNTWKGLSVPSLPTTGVDFHDIVFHPVSSDTVFLVTSLGCYKSSDKGQTFSKVTSTISPTQSIIFSPANPSIVFGADTNGPLKSTDGGNTWIALKDNFYFGNRFVSHIAVHPSDTGNSIRILAATGFADTVGLFFSSNSGTTWRPFNKGLPAGNARRIYKVNIDSMGIGKVHFRALIGTADGMYGVQSDYFDTAWTTLKTNNSPSPGVVTSGMLVYDKLDLTAPQNDQHKFALYYSSNASEYEGTPRPFTEKNGLFKIGSKYNTLFTISIVEPPPVQRIFAGLGDIASIFIPSNANKSKIYLGTTNGIFISNDNGITWQRKNAGLNFTAIRTVVSLASVNGANIIFAGIVGGGVMRSTDEGATWSAVNNGIASPYVLSLIADKKENILYAGTTYSIYRSVDLGSTWIELFKVDSSKVLRPSRYTNSDHEITVRHSPVKSTNLLLNSSAYGLWISTNGGGTWNTLAPPVQTDSGGIPESIEFDPIDASTIYASSNGLFKSTTAGQSWIDISSNLPKQGFNPFTQTMDGIVGLSPTINPENSNEIFLATSFKQGQGIPFRLFRTTNSGTSWDPMSTPIPVYDILYDRLDVKRIVAGGPAGMYRTINGGNSWSRITDSLSSTRYYLLGEHLSNPNIFYSGSEQGAFRIELNDYPKLTIDTSLYDFGSKLIAADSLRTIPLKNLTGNRNVILSFTGLSDTVSFRYSGPLILNIPAGGQFQIPVVFAPQSRGIKSAILRFTTTDPALPVVVITLRGFGFERFPFEKFSFAFGSIAVQKDSLLTVSVPNESQQALGVTVLANSDSINFSLVNGPTITIDSGSVGSMVFRYHPNIAGEHRAVFRFATTDIRFPNVYVLLTGNGVPKNIYTRSVVLDTSFGSYIDGTMLITDYYSQLRNALIKAGLNVVLQKTHKFIGNHSLVICQPTLPIENPMKDSLQHFVSAGGTLVVLADQRDSSARLLNQFLRDPSWASTYGTPTGMQFFEGSIIDSTLIRAGLDGALISTRVRLNRYTAGVDSLISYYGTRVIVDSTVNTTNILFSAASSSLYTKNSDGAVDHFSGPAATAAISTIGSGRIIAIADPELWWNGSQEDTSMPFGIYGAQNLQFALNIFGSIENIIAELRETVEQRYVLISIPYSFEDSSVATLFKDLGSYNAYLWRMFGKYSKNEGYKEFPKDFTRIKRGEGYWLITKEKKKVSLGSTSMPGIAEDFEIKINPGFTMIGNPFPYSVSWTNSTVEDSVEKVLWSYTNGVYDSTTLRMDPFKGYWVFNRGRLPKSIVINAVPVSSSAIPKSGSSEIALGSSEWKVQLVLSSPHEADAQNYIGVVNDALDGWDHADFVKPPSAPSVTTNLSLLNHGEKLSADYRKENPNGHVWDFIVNSTGSVEPLQITANRFGIIPHQFKLYLIDTRRERVYNLGNTAEYSFSLEKKEHSRQFRLIAGTSEFFEQNSDGIPIIPLEYSLSQNFPNPFNPVTTILYTLSHSGVVQLEIFNILGQKIRTMVNSQQPIGTYSVTWDGKDNHGILLSSGIYYYQIQANNFRSVKKMTFIK